MPPRGEVRCSKSHLIWGTWIALATALLVGGCVKQPVSQSSHTGSPLEQSNAQNSSGVYPVDMDPCGARLHDIGGQMLDYYVTKQHLPQRLDELRSFVDLLQEPNYTCPVSHQPYTYDPQGLVRPGEDRRLIVFDSAPVHKDRHGAPSRWGLFIILAKGKQPLETRSDLIPEAVFRTYVPAAVPLFAPPASQPGG